jgi:hypothetical protein
MFEMDKPRMHVFSTDALASATPRPEYLHVGVAGGITVAFTSTSAV